VVEWVQSPLDTQNPVATQTCVVTVVLLLLSVNCQLKPGVKVAKFDYDLNAHDDNDLYDKFIGHFGKGYAKDSQEGNTRFVHFQRTLNHIRKRNKEVTDFQLAVNHLSDHTPDEITQKLGLKHDVASVQKIEKTYKQKRNFLSTKMKANQSGPWAPINWSSYFLDARDQGICGSCWAFSISGVLEASVAIRTGVKQYLAPQYLINCDTLDGGCNGGAFSNTFQWIKTNGGTVAETALSYLGVAGVCDPLLTSKVAATAMTGFSFCSISSDSNKCTESIVYSMLQQGPLNVGIDASSPDFQSYASGVYTPTCTLANHAVILAGYGIDAATGKQYWLIRNSWSTAWGMNGFIQLFRNDANFNSCFTMQEAWLPTFN